MPQITGRFTGLKTSVRLQQQAGRLKASINQAETQSAEAFKQQAIRLSSGPYTTQVLQQMARKLNAGFGLYSRRSPMPPAPAFVINQQSGDLARSWFVAVHVDQDGTSVRLFNTSPHAADVLGEQGRANMIPRPLLMEVYARENPARLARLNAAKRKALK